MCTHTHTYIHTYIYIYIYICRRRESDFLPARATGADCRCPPRSPTTSQGDPPRQPAAAATPAPERARYRGGLARARRVRAGLRRRAACGIPTGGRPLATRRRRRRGTTHVRFPWCVVQRVAQAAWRRRPTARRRAAPPAARRW